MIKLLKNLFLAALSLAVPVVVHAAEPMFGDVGVEFLYFKPSIEQSSYVVSSSLNAAGDEFFPSGHRHLNTSSYKPGFRVTASAPMCSSWNDFEARFTYLYCNQSDSTTGLFLFDTNGYPGEGAQSPEDTSYNGTARIKETFKYLSADTTFNRFVLDGCDENLVLRVGLHAAYILHHTRMTSVGTFGGAAASPVSNLLRNQSQFWGIGPQIGLDYRYDFLCNIALAGSVRGALLCSDSNAHLHYSSLRTVGTNGVNLKNDHLWRVNPAFDAKLGAVYEFTCYCYESSLEVGYEWIWYSNAVNVIRGTDVAFPGNSLDVYNDFSVQGPYVRLAVSF